MCGISSLTFRCCCNLVHKTNAKNTEVTSVNMCASFPKRNGGFRLKPAVTVLTTWMLRRVQFDLSHQRYAQLMLSAVITIQQGTVYRGFAPKRKVKKMDLPSHHYWYLTTSLLDTVTIRPTSLVS